MCVNCDAEYETDDVFTLKLHVKVLLSEQVDC